MENISFMRNGKEFKPTRAELERVLDDFAERLAILEKALELAVEELDDAKDMLRDAGKNDWAGMIDTSVDYFKARAKEMIKSE